MAKIYDEKGNRMTTEQVITALEGFIPQDHMELMAKAIENTSSATNPANYRLAHAILEAYKLLDTTASPEHEKSKKYLKNLLDKYMKSSMEATKAELAAYDKLIVTILRAPTHENEG